ncbi:NADH-plastoquinone oxidoreductase, chain 5 [Moorella glycerini]|uniref:NADH-quinone oxidoreductase subunit 12 n=1 Tax=Neomoorella stamsii TaxID=1266720 RepID=A0A9X7J523_9FIRM|nr:MULTISPECIES: NADH-quinone oxidoreductase subunit L [Moorella]PRR76072.1 NADH-quinone oxidoreductase subunit 12 [Moorella stamsii]CEP68322.1 NADH-plastoquinone oxidoreductase, chain 5 [Moorella glycerini]
MIKYAWLIPVFPAVAFPIIIFLTRKVRLLSALVAIAAIAASFVMAVGVLREVFLLGVTMEKPVEYAAPWLQIPGLLKIEAGILIDPLAAVMLLVVTLVALLVEIYSVGYMHGDPGFSSFFSYLSLFSASMLGLVLANNYFMIFFFWELVGLCSYLLIGFYYHKHSAARAGLKAFVTNRVADFGFMLGFFFLFAMFGTFNFRELAEAIPGYQNTGFLALAAALVFIGPIGKSAQFPLHVWLPDAMEGPTPVSALIHAATMVAAGVYLLARAFVLFASLPGIMLLVAYVGGFTALLAATIAVAQRDIKRILAYSTMSQLGYMVMAMGVGSMTAGMFHLMTHAFFKALLFLGAGSVIHALEEQDIFRMGGLYKDMKVTASTFIIAALALAGLPPLAGFWSKDEILAAAFDHGFTGLYILGTLVAFMTAFYMFRLIFVAFFGNRRAGLHGHESPLTMTVPLLILAVLSVVAGFAGAPFVSHGFSTFVYYGEPHHVEPNYAVMLLSTLVALAGIGLAWLLYGRPSDVPEKLATRYRSIYTLLVNKFYIDEIYMWLFRRVVLGLSEAFNWHDRHVVDGIFDGVGDVTRISGQKLRFLQTGNLQTYALVIFTAVVIIALWMAAPVLGGVIQ